MRRILVFVFLGIFGLVAFRNVAFGQKPFPTAWLGEWHGTLEIFGAKGKVQSLPMELHLHPIDSIAGGYTFTIVYGEDKEAGRRPYHLLTLDAATGRYLLDERNGIRMEAYFVNGKLIQWFEVQGALLYTSVEKVGRRLVWEIVSGSSKPVSTTGGGIAEGEEIPPVQAYPVSGLQRAVLKRRR
jgi:hypothetical protein